jgi:endoglucanase
VGRGYRSPATAATLGIVSGMILSPANEVDIFRIFNGDDGAYDPAEVAVYRDNMQSYSATEPAIDLTSTSFLMWSRRSAHHASLWTDTP